ncbi:hypothetical protein LM597_04520 [Candidatus Acetothermia bacterium]|nr:hypothetical protein [Candidatus Acetothermia bacterium]
MRTKLVVGLLVLGLAVSGLGLIDVAAATTAPEIRAVSNTVTWTIHRFLRIAISRTAVDFGTIDGLADTAQKLDAAELTIESNINWSISFAVTGTARDHLQVVISCPNDRQRRAVGTGTRNRVLRVDYSLRNLLQLEPGNYTVTVTFTVTPR